LRARHRPPSSHSTCSARDGESLIERTQRERRAELEELLAGREAAAPSDAATTERSQRAQWLQHFEGAGLDGIVAKPIDGPYRSGKRVMLKIKHVRTADCVVAGFRWHKSTSEPGTEAVGSLLLGLFDDAGVLHHVGITSSFTMEMRRSLVRELAPLRNDALAAHPWRGWAEQEAARAAPGPAEQRARIDSSGCPARRAAGAPARTCRGSRSDPNASAR
jgi:ATP-dependent DNA ligase